MYNISIAGKYTKIFMFYMHTTKKYICIYKYGMIGLISNFARFKIRYIKTYTYAYTTDVHIKYTVPLHNTLCIFLN